MPDAPGGSVLVAGVGELYQGDLDLGRIAVERLAEWTLPPWVQVEELSYGAVAVAQRLEDLRPRALLLVTAIARDRPPGSVTRHEVADLPVDPVEVQRYVADAVTGYVDIDVLSVVANAMGCLPAHTVVFEVEPDSTTPGLELSAPALAGLTRALELVFAEIDALAASSGAPSPR